MNRDRVEIRSQAGAVISHFAMIPYMADNELNPYEMRLLVHYVRRAGENLSCWEGTDESARICQMDARKVRETRKSLMDRGYIYIEERAGKTPLITVVNIWDKNRSLMTTPNKNVRPTPNKNAGTPLTKMQDEVYSQVEPVEVNKDSAASGEVAVGVPSESEEKQNAKATLEVTLEAESSQPEKPPTPAATPRPTKTPDWQTRPWLYAQEPLSNEVYQGLSKTDQNTAIFSMICWHLMYTAPATGEDVFNRLSAAKGKRGLEHRLLSLLIQVNERTPQSLKDFAVKYRASEFGKKALDPALLRARYEEHLATHRPAPSAVDPKDLPWMYQAYFYLFNVEKRRQANFALKEPQYMLKALVSAYSNNSAARQYLETLPEWKQFIAERKAQ